MSIDLHDLLDRPLAGEPVPVLAAARLAVARQAMAGRRRKHSVSGALAAVVVVAAALLVPASRLGQHPDSSRGSAAAPASTDADVRSTTSVGTDNVSAEDLGDLCPPGSLPMLKIDFKVGDEAPSAATPGLALATLLPDADLSGAGSALLATRSRDPVWVAVEDRTYVIQTSGVGNWRAFPASLQACEPVTVSKNKKSLNPPRNPTTKR